MPSSDTRWPRKLIGDLNKTHLEGLAFRPHSRSRVNTVSKRSISCPGSSAEIIISSKKQRHCVYSKSDKTVCIKRQNVEGALAKPKGIFVN